jgi:phenylpropionate dioxygenase-like ring-hydroxylating dioxygenase large terminal subunit
MKGMLPESAKLKEVIEKQGWTLFLATQPKGRRKPFTWEEFETNGPAPSYSTGNNYIFAPIPARGQTLRQAYAVTKGLGPSLVVHNPNEDRWITLYIHPWEHDEGGVRAKKGRPIHISRLLFFDEGVAASSPKTRYNPDPDMIGIAYPYLIDTFERYFRIVTPQEYGLSTPVPIPFFPEDN